MDSPLAGIVVQLAGEGGDLIPSGSTLAVIETEGDGEVEAPPADTPVEQEIVAETPGAEEVSVAEVAPTPESVRAELVEEQSLPSEEKSSASTSSGQAGHGKSVLASHAVRARATDLGVDLNQVHNQGDRDRHADLDASLRYT